MAYHATDRDRHLGRGLASLLIALLLVFSIGALDGCYHQPIAPGATTTSAQSIPAFKHIFVIVMENKDYTQVIDNHQAPYLSNLAQQYGIANAYSGIRHPSLPNYLAITGGDTFGITSDCTDCFIAKTNLVDLLESHGKTWKAYMESMPTPCFVGDAEPLYRQKHNPFIYYDNVRTNRARCNKIVPLTDFAADIQANTIPDFVWITPNMCNDMHDCPISTGDAWLKTWVPAILRSSAWQDQGVLFITFDEGTISGACCWQAARSRLATLVISPLGKPHFVSETPYTHYSLLHTIAAAWQLPLLRKTNYTQPMSDFFTPPAAPSPPATR